MRIRPPGAADHRTPHSERVRNLMARLPSLLAHVPTRLRVAAAVAVPLLLVLAVSEVGSAEGGRGHSATATRWVSSASQVAGQPSPAAVPGSADNGRDGPSGTASQPGRPGSNAGSSATPSGPPSGPGSPTPPPDPGNFLARIPQFDPLPTAERISLPEEPSAPFLSRIPTTQKVAFLTIDDGWTKRPEAVQLFRAAHIPVTLFLTINAIRDNPGYFKQLEANGGVIEAHTLTHTELKGKPYDFQKHEICGSADQLGSLYGRRPVLFRPPFGDKDAVTLQATHDCGLKAAFFWKETVDKGVVRFQEGHTVQPGDILLMHFRPAFVDDFLAALQAIHDAGLTPALLDDYIPQQ